MFCSPSVHQKSRLETAEDFLRKPRNVIFLDSSQWFCKFKRRLTIHARAYCLYGAGCYDFDVWANPLLGPLEGVSAENR